MPSRFFSRMLADELETVTVVGAGFTTGTDADGNPIRVPASDQTVVEMDIQPMSGGTMRLLPEGIRETASLQGFVNLDDDASDKRSWLVAGRELIRADGSKVLIRYVTDHSTHLLLALEQAD